MKARGRLITSWHMFVGVTAALVGFSTASAQAFVHTASITYAAPTNPPSLNPQPPADQQGEYAQTEGVSYDDQTGTVTVTATVYDPSYWGEQLGRIEVDLLPDVCPTSVETYNGDAVLTAAIGANPAQSNPDGSTTPAAVYGHLTRAGYDGQIDAVGTFDGTTFAATFTNPNLARLALVCAWFPRGPSADPSVDPSDTATLTQPPPPTARTASAAFVGKLPVGAQLPVNEGLACPAADLSVILQGYGSCFAEYTLGGLWHLASGGVKVTNGALVATISNTATWRRKWRVCRQRGWRVAGTNLVVPGASNNTLVTNNDCGREAPQSDVYFVQQEMIYGCGRGSIPNRSGCRVGAREVGWQFTDSAGFNSIGRFPCKHHGRTYTCTNAVGDSFKYTP